VAAVLFEHLGDGWSSVGGPKFLVKMVSFLGVSEPFGLEIWMLLMRMQGQLIGGDAHPLEVFLTGEASLW
jgi:hypothetical protein